MRKSSTLPMTLKVAIIPRLDNMKNHSSKCASNKHEVVNMLPVPYPCDCDGYHTFGELYDHRITLWVALCRAAHEIRKLADGARALHGEKPEGPVVWRSKVHADGSVMEGWYILGIFKEKGAQITYHLPLSRWEETDFAETLEKGPEWDGHTSDDVLKRLKNI